MPGQLGAASAVLVALANLDAVVPCTDLLSTRILMAAWLAAFTMLPGTSSASESTSNSLSHGSWDGKKLAALAPCSILPVAAAPNTWWLLLCPRAPWAIAASFSYWVPVTTVGVPNHAAKPDGANSWGSRVPLPLWAVWVGFQGAGKKIGSA